MAIGAWIWGLNVIKQEMLLCQPKQSDPQGLEQPHSKPKVHEVSQRKMKEIRKQSGNSGKPLITWYKR